MPELGAYAGTVLSAYGITLAALAGLIAYSWLRARAAKARLAAAEARP